MTEEETCAELRPLAEEICLGHLSDFTVDKCLGAGASAAVYKIVNGEVSYALKVYHPQFFSSKNRRIERKRIDLQKTLKDHGRDDLIKIYDAKEASDTAFVLMEFVDWQPLSKLVGKVPSAARRGIITKVASAAKFLEERRLTHRDIKPANILVSPDFTKAKLLDLGVIRALDSADAAGSDFDGELAFVATAQYSSPEYLFRLGECNDDFWRALTFYQLGGIIHDLLVGNSLFDQYAKTKNKYVLAYAVLMVTPTIALDPADAALVKLGRDCLIKDMRVRLARVTWSDFSPGGATDSDLRSRLGLGPGGHSRTDRRALEQRKIELTEAAQSLRSALMPLMKSQGYPVATINVEGNSSAERLLSVRFGIREPEVPGDQLLVNALLKLEEAGAVMEISASGFLARGDKNFALSSDIHVWSSNLSETSIEASKMAEALEAVILQLYADATAGVAATPTIGGMEGS